MKKVLIWFIAFIITLGAAYYQRTTGPTYPKRVSVALNDSLYQLKLVRSIGLDNRPEVKLNIKDTTIKAVLYYKRFNTQDEYLSADFKYKVYPIHSSFMNKILKIYEEKGLYAEVPQQPAAGKIQYYIEFNDSKGTQTIMKDTPVVIRFKGGVPGYILLPHILIMFFAMLFSTGAGLLAVAKISSYKKYGILTLVLLITGGLVLGPIVQKFAFGKFWTGVPIGWDLTDNKTLIALLFWVFAIIVNLRKEKPLYTVLAAIVLLIVFSIPHSLFGSQLNYSTGQVTQGLITGFFFISKKKILN